MSLEFRAAVPADRPSLVRFVLAVAREAEALQLDPAVVDDGLAQALDRPQHRQYYLAELDGRPVGCCLVTTEWSDWTARWYWWFQSVYVEPLHRGDPPGVWPRMYAWVRDRAREGGVEKLLLYAHAKNARAIRAYEKVGMRRATQLVFEAPTRAT